MKTTHVRRLSAIIAILLALALLLVSCKEYAEPLFLMREFCKSYGVDSVVFSPSVKEGEDGYTDSSFFESVWSDGEELVESYAVFFLSNLSTAGECALFLCYSESDAITATEILTRRIELIRSLGSAIDSSFCTDAFVMKSGRYVVMCALGDNERAREIWERLV